MKMTTNLALGVLAAGAAMLAALSTASAKRADCYTTDDGNYPCEFISTDGAGSFELHANGYPTTILIIDSPGVGSVFKDFGTGRNVALPGPYYRASDDGACWDNPDTGDRLCAW